MMIDALDFTGLFFVRAQPCARKNCVVLQHSSGLLKDITSTGSKTKIKMSNSSARKAVVVYIF